MESTRHPIVGGCLCGAVRYTSKSPPLMTAICSCKHCQRQSGTAFSVLVAVTKGSLEFVGDEPSTYHDSGSSGSPVLRRFCAKCGSPIFSEVAVTPAMDWLKAGTLDDASWLEPTVGIWDESAQPWVPKSDRIAYFPQSPPAAG